MDEWIVNLYKNNKIVFFLLIPIVLLVVFRNVVIDLLVGSAHKVADEAKKKDDVLKADETKANDAADALRNQANAPKDDTVDENWNKK